MSREGQRQERAGQRPYNASRAGPADDLLPGEAQQKPTPAAAPEHAKSQVKGPLPPEPARPEQCPEQQCPEHSVPSRIRTCGLLLRSNPAVDAVATSGDAGQVSGGPRCCSPSYLVIAIEGTGPHDRRRGMACT